MTIYLAGYDVFMPNAKERGETLKNLCALYKHRGLFPLDSELKEVNPANLAKKIKEANIEMIHESDIVIANLNSFRGTEPDSGTVWEVGFAQGLGKKVYGYCEDQSDYRTKVIEILKLDGDIRDNQGMEIEDFGLTHNLMFADCVISNSFEGCLKRINEDLAKETNMKKSVTFTLEIENGEVVVDTKVSDDSVVLGDIASIMMSCVNSLKNGNMSLTSVQNMIASVYEHNNDVIQPVDKSIAG